MTPKPPPIENIKDDRVFLHNKYISKAIQGNNFGLTMVKTLLGRTATLNSELLTHIYCVREHTWNQLHWLQNSSCKERETPTSLSHPYLVHQ